jgi:hypothetical protein
MRGCTALHWQRPTTAGPTTFHVCKTRGCLCSFRLLMMGGVSHETSWASFKIRNKQNYDTLLHLVGFVTVSNRIVVATATSSGYLSVYFTQHTHCRTNFTCTKCILHTLSTLHHVSAHLTCHHQGAFAVVIICFRVMITTTKCMWSWFYKLN